MHTTIRQFIGALRKGLRLSFEEVVTILRRDLTDEELAPLARLADAHPILGTHPVRPTATSAGVSPSVARRLGIASGALAAALGRPSNARMAWS